MIDVAISSDGNIRKKEHEKLKKIPRAERKARKDVKGEGKSGPPSNQKTWGCDPQTGRVATADSRSKIQDLCPEACSSMSSRDTVQDPRAPRPLVEHPSLKEGRRPAKGSGEFLFSLIIEN